MKTESLDIVYTVKDCALNEELRYSLRSLKNLPHRKVWIYGGLPDCVNPETVEYVKVEQNKGNKWDNTAWQLIKICENDDITEDFIWFNDDFYVMKKMDELKYYKDRNLSARIRDFVKKNIWSSRGKYCQRLRRAEWALNKKGLPTNNYELHIPMIFNREKLSQIIRMFPGEGAKRSLYGNTFVKDAIQRDDVKIYEHKIKPTGDEDFLSSMDMTFRSGEIGKYIRTKFKGKSPYELDKREE